MITLPVKRKYLHGGTAKKASPGGGNDQGTKHANKKKASDKERAEIHARQPKMTMLVRGGKRRMVKVGGA